jgi:hypothetical protein
VAIDVAVRVVIEVDVALADVQAGEVQPGVPGGHHAV